MTTPNEPLLSEEQRKRLESYRYEDACISAALAEIDRLRAQVEALAEELMYVCHDRMEEGAARLVERAVSEEREACAAMLHALVAENVRDMIHFAEEEFAARLNNATLKSCVRRIRARGPILPPLPPTVMQRRYEEMRTMLERIAAADKRIGEGVPFRPTLSQSIEAARELLEKK